MSPTKIYVLFWIGIMTVFLGVSFGIMWQLHKLTMVLTEILKHLKH